MVVARHMRLPVVLDGALGTELMRAGHALPAPLWSASLLSTNPAAVTEVHRAYVRAGAQVLTTNTFRTHARTFEQAGLTARDARRATEAAVACCRDALDASAQTWVAGSVAPVEDCYEPSRRPSDSQLVHEHGQLVGWLAELGVDVLLLETMNNLAESVIAARAAASHGLPVWVSFVVTGRGTQLLSGESLAEAAQAVVEQGAGVVGVNCVDLAQTEVALAHLRESVSVPLVAYPNGGVLAHDGSWSAEGGPSPERFGQAAQTWLNLGAQVVGGCCGTRPDHVAALRRVVDKRVQAS